MKAPGEKDITRKYDLLVAALLAEPTISEAAKVAGIGETTVFRYFKDDAFQEKYREAKKQAVQQAICHLQRSSGKAVKVLLDVAEDDNCPASARVSAAKTIIELALKGVEIDDLERRITDLERFVKNEGAKK